MDPMQNGCAAEKPTEKKKFRIDVQEVENGFLIYDANDRRMTAGGKIWVARNCDALTTVITKLYAQHQKGEL